jgi:hypothetical protein
MSAARKSLFPAALMLALIMGSAAPARAQGGIWTYLYLLGDNITLSVVNLTTQRLVITSPATGYGWKLTCSSLGNATDCLRTQSHPFQMASSTPPDCPGTLCIDPYRTAIWGSFGNDRKVDGDFAWDGRFSVAYLDSARSEWTVLVNAASQSPGNRKNGKGTWFYLNTIDQHYSSCTDYIWYNPFGVVDPYPYLYGTYAPDGIYVTPILYPGEAYDTWPFSVMTMSGNDCGGLFSGRPVISLFAGVDNHPVLVFREDLGGDNYIGWALYYVDQPDSSFP